MEDKLIVAVCAHRELYDPSCHQYRDRNRRELAWRRISEEIGISEQICKTRWKSLRDKYKKEVNKEQERRKSGAEAGSAQRWKYLAVLSFLDPYITPRATSGNMAPRVEKQAAGYDQSQEPEEEAAAAEMSELAADPELPVPETPVPESPVPEPSAVAAAASSSASSGQAGPSSAPRPSGAPKKRNRKRLHQEGSETTTYERELLAALKARDERPPCSDDEHFLLSLVPLLQKVPPQSKDFVKFQIHKIIYESSTFALNLEPLEPTQ